MREAMLWNSLEDAEVNCKLCSHYCRIKEGLRGKCGVRENREGQLYSLAYELVAAINLDPIEKKPLFHFLPGTRTFSFGTMGCNMTCAFCQNSSLSQSPAEGLPVRGQPVTPELLVESALRSGAKSVSYTYSEPTVFFELMRDTALLVKRQGLKNVMVSNGFMSPECLSELAGLIDAANIDLKGFSESFYREVCGARLKPVLKNLKIMRELGWWLEVTTLLIPELNDSEAELKELAAFIVSELGPQTPWHISRFHPDYRMLNKPATPRESLERAYAIGREAGLEYVYMGNLPGGRESTSCPDCGKTLIERQGFSLGRVELGASGKCACGREIAGVFG